MSDQAIRVKKLRVANWQGGDVEIPHNCWTAITGASGSGKTSLLFGALQTWSSKQFELLVNPAARVGPFVSSSIAEDVTGLTPVIASAGEIPRQRGKACLLEVLNLEPLIKNWWKIGGLYHCAHCRHQWSVCDSYAVVDACKSKISHNEVVMIVSRLERGTSPSELLMLGATRYFDGKQLHRLEDCDGALAQDSWLLHDRFKGVNNNESRFVEALNVAKARNQRVAIVIGDNVVEVAVNRFCPECQQRHDCDDATLRYIGDCSEQSLRCSTLRVWLGLVDDNDQSVAANVLRNATKCGLHHLQVNRTLKTLSLGESRRIELLVWIAQARTRQTLIFDEPGIGLHGQERAAVASLFRELVQHGNTVITADPSYEFLAAADHCLVVGPGSGKDGGRICAQGSFDELKIDLEFGFAEQSEVAEHFIEFENLTQRHLKIDKLHLPLESIVAVCGVSGSGKSTLFTDELWPRLKEMQKTHPHLTRGGVHSLLQRSLGTSARSTLATLSGCWQELRELFANTVVAKRRGFKSSDFVANPSRGGCSSCKGLAVDSFGEICQECDGLALRQELLQLRYRGASLREWLSLPLNGLSHLLPVKGKLRTCVDLLIKLGLGSRRLSERGRVFSFGERGRIALAKRLNLIRPGSSKLFLLDEACLGLPDSEAADFLAVLRDYCKQGHSFWLIEHHHLVLRNADYLIEIGPQAAERGGEVVFTGHPSLLPQADTATSRWLSNAIVASDKTAPQCSVKPSFEVYTDGCERSGYQRLQTLLASELSMRSVLEHDQFLDTSADSSRLSFPVAWPTMVAARTTLLDCLGLDSHLQNLLKAHGEFCCSACGEEGPYTSVEHLVSTFSEQGTLHLACSIPADIAQHPQRETWLAAAGYRDFIGEDMVVLDCFSCDLDEEELRERCSDVQQQLTRFKQNSITVFDSNEVLRHSVDLSACRSCQQQAPLEHRYKSYGIGHYRQAKLDDVLGVFSDVECDIIKRAVHLLSPSSLFSISCCSTMQSLTAVEQRAARLISLLLFGPRELCMLFDNVLAGFPVKLGQFLAQECRQSNLLMQHADAAGYFAAVEQNTLGSSQPVPQSFQSQLRVSDFLPQQAKSDVRFGTALSVDLYIADYFSRCETAKMRGITSADLLPNCKNYSCHSCDGGGRIRLHAALSVPCSACTGSGFSLKLSDIIERGLSFTQAQVVNLSALADYFEGSSIAPVLAAACACGLGDFKLADYLDALPLAAQTLAPTLASLALSDSDIRIHNTFDGLNALQVPKVCSTIQGLVDNRSLLEWRENHPQFTT